MEKFFNTAVACNLVKHCMLSAAEGVAGSNMAKPWDGKISHEDRMIDGKPIHRAL